MLHVYGHKRLRECPFAENTAKEIRDAKGNVKRIRGDTGARPYYMGEHDISDQTGNA